MQVRRTVIVLMVSGAMFAQAAPPSCPASCPIDDIIAEVHQEQSKKRHRNTDPLPQIHCSWGWCIDVSTTPPTIPEPARSADVPNRGNATPITVPIETCGDAMKAALEAAHNVEVGDYYFGERNYDGSLLRYQDALEEKPGDLAIYVRLGEPLKS